MPDEIDLLRRFRDGTPGPNETAWERARAAIAEAEAEAEAGATEPGEPARHPRRKWRPTGRRVAIVTAVATVAAVVAALLVVTMQGQAGPGKSWSTAWQPAHPLPGSSGLQAPAGTWRLTSNLVRQGWQEDTSGPEPGALTCPTASTCYVVGINPILRSGPPAKITSFYVSTDGAQTWSVLPVPAGISFTSSLSCTTEVACVAGGLYRGDEPVYLVTGDGGHSWTIHPLPGSVGEINQLDCAKTGGICQGLAGPVVHLNPKAPRAFTIPVTRFVTITGDGHVTATTFPAGEVINGISCPTATECVATGDYEKLGPRYVPGAHYPQGFSIIMAPGTKPVPGKPPAGRVLLHTPLVLTSVDGGASWHEGRLPAIPGLDPFEAVTCADASHCQMLGYNGGHDFGSVVAFSSDGGTTWTISSFPDTIQHSIMNSLACPTATTCYAAGMASIPMKPGVAYNGDPYDNTSSAVVAVTTDAGRTWRRISFRVPRSVGDPYPEIGVIQCPRPNACVALGVSGANSKSTPVYSNDGTP
ncbi:MAG TPA: sialidase family protein [Trebonia sp.]|jgi:photosystem II stability/assembly factor-like uncharacterized protein|nr:sialidase family protein [Trebonia sp.]